MKSRLFVLMGVLTGFIFYVTGCIYTTNYTGGHVITENNQVITEVEPGQNVISLIDGSEIRGEIISQNRTKITVRTKYTTMTIEKKNIKEIKYK